MLSWAFEPADEYLLLEFISESDVSRSSVTVTCSLSARPAAVWCACCLTQSMQIKVITCQYLHVNCIILRKCQSKLLHKVECQACSLHAVHWRLRRIALANSIAKDCKEPNVRRSSYSTGSVTGVLESHNMLKIPGNGYHPYKHHHFVVVVSSIAMWLAPLCCTAGKGRADAKAWAKASGALAVVKPGLEQQVSERADQQSEDYSGLEDATPDLDKTDKLPEAAALQGKAAASTKANWDSTVNELAEAVDKITIHTNECGRMPQSKPILLLASNANLLSNAFVAWQYSPLRSSFTTGCTVLWRKCQQCSFEAELLPATLHSSDLCSCWSFRLMQTGRRCKLM